jgi:prepilin-type N-terminal cleavage/methylation domain-containing protein
MKEAEGRSQKTEVRRQKSKIFNSKLIRFNPDIGGTTQNSKLHSKGFTLIELIIFIIIAGIFLPATYVAFSASMRNATQPEDFTRGRLLAEEVMELGTKRGYTLLKSYIDTPLSKPPCGASSGDSIIGRSVPTGFSCTLALINLPNNFAGLTLTGTNYIQIDVSVTTPQGNTFSSTGMVTNHGF